MKSQFPSDISSRGINCYHTLYLTHTCSLIVSLTLPHLYTYSFSHHKDIRSFSCNKDVIVIIMVELNLFDVFIRELKQGSETFVYASIIYLKNKI